MNQKRGKKSVLAYCLWGVLHSYTGGDQAVSSKDYVGLKVGSVHFVSCLPTDSEEHTCSSLGLADSQLYFHTWRQKTRKPSGGEASDSAFPDHDLWQNAMMW